MTFKNQSSQNQTSAPNFPNPALSSAEHQQESGHYRRQFEAICNNATVSLFIMDERQQCIYMNPAAEKLTGYTLAEAQGRPLHYVVHHTHPDGTPYPLEECPIDQAFPQNNQEQGEEIFVHKDGSFYPVAFTASPIREEGLPVGTIIEVRGIAEEKRAVEERERLLQLEQEAREETEIINRLGQMLSAELDLQKLVQAVTDAATELTDAQFGSFFYNLVDARGESYMLYTLSGVPREAFANFPMPHATELFGPTFRGEGIMRIADVRQDPRYGKHPPHYGMPEGHLPVVSYLAVPVISRSGEVLGGLFFGHADAGVFTERHERIVVGLAAQTAIAMDNARLFEAAQRDRAKAERAAVENERLYREASEAGRLKDEFLAMLSHELRTPLTAILGWARMLSDGGLNEEQTVSAMEAIERNAMVQARLIEDILDVSRIITGKLRLEVCPVNLAPVIEAAVEAVTPAAEAKSIRLQRVLDSTSTMVSGDPARLQQVVWNLLSNAIKFTPKGGRAQVRLERVNSHVEIIVTDTGKGIKPEMKPFIFDRFRQADSSTTREHGGLGLGLAIVRHIVELHGGQVDVESEGEGHGATFIVKLPLIATRSSRMHPGNGQQREHPAESTSNPAFTCPPELDQLHVLTVDDEADTRALITTVLEKCGARVTAVGSAAEALEELTRSRPDVLISDIGMMGQDGYSLIKQVRALPASRGGRTPAAALTAYARVEDRMHALRSGFQIHLAKPVDPVELVTVIANLAGRFNGVDATTPSVTIGEEV